MAEAEDDIEELECLDLNQMIEEKEKEKNKTMRNIKINPLSSTMTKKTFMNTINFQKPAVSLFKETRCLDDDMENYLKEAEEANSMLSDNFKIIGNKTQGKNLTQLLKSTIQRARENQILEVDEPESNSLMSTLKTVKEANESEPSSLMSTLKIDREKENETMKESIKESMKESMKQSMKESMKESMKDSLSYSKGGTGGSIITSICEGLEIGSYTFDGAVKISKLLGEGAQAKVYLGVTEDEEDEDNSEQLVMAVKHFTFDIGSKRDAINKEIDSLVNKCQTLKELSHDNIIQYFDCESEYKEDTQNYIVNIAMEFQDTNLTDFMIRYTAKNKVKTLPKDLIAKITKKIVEGLAYLHEHKIIHRDLKPENILMSVDSSSVKIGDFGISIWIKESQNKMKNKIYNYTRDFMKRTVAGTGIYMAPEVLLCSPYGYDCDIWSLGCIVFEMAGGIKPSCTNEPGKAVPSTELQLVKYSSPLEIADENVKDIKKKKKNRDLLDFLQKCWRGNNVYRPTARELLQHPFLKKVK